MVFDFNAPPEKDACASFVRIRTPEHVAEATARRCLDKFSGENLVEGEIPAGGAEFDKQLYT